MHRAIGAILDGAATPPRVRFGCSLNGQPTDITPDQIGAQMQGLL
jgi:hypothetical protein